MIAIIPVAGVGKRLRPHTLTKPKVLLNVAGKPMLYYIVNQLIREKIPEEIIFITGYFGDRIEKYIRDNFKYKFRFITQDKQKGLGHAVYCAKNAFKNNEDVLIILGDTLFDVDVKKICHSRYSIIGTKKVDDARRFGVVEKNKNGFITRLVEKPESSKVSPSKDAIVGIYYLKNSDKLFESLEHIIENNITSSGEIQLTDALQIMITHDEKIKTYRIQVWLDCGKPETILETNRYLLDKHSKKYNYKDAVIIHPVFIGKKTEIKNSVIGPYTTIGDNCIIRDSVIRNSIIDQNSSIRNVVITDSIIGNDSLAKGRIKTLNISEYSDVEV